MNDLLFSELRRANLARLPEFKNAKGEIIHTEPDGSDKPLTFWMAAVCGEIGEAANIAKKIERGDFTLDEARAALAEELADAQTYLDLVANLVKINLPDAVADKFNVVSERVGSQVTLEPVSGHYRAHRNGWPLMYQ